MLRSTLNAAFSLALRPLSRALRLSCLGDFSVKFVVFNFEMFVRFLTSFCCAEQVWFVGKAAKKSFVDSSSVSGSNATDISTRTAA